MKKILNIFLLLLLSVGITSCADDEGTLEDTGERIEQETEEAGEELDEEI